MILKASQRGGALALARHLQRTDENDHVEVHELRGFAAETLAGALHEIAAVARGTRCRQCLFSISLNPPESEAVPIKVFEQALCEIERSLGLEGQPRAIVFHEKEGRRHAHAVWSRINVNEMKAINLPHFKRKLQTISKQVFLEQGWHLPDGLRERGKGNPLNFSRKEWQQAKRTKQDPRSIKMQFQEAWATSDNAESSAAALEERGIFLARGDRRGFVAVDVFGEVYSLSKWTGQKSKAVKERLGCGPALKPVTAVKKDLAERIGHNLGGYIHEVQKLGERRSAALALKKSQLRQRQRAERAAQTEAQKVRREAEARERAARFRRGLLGLWDWLSGKSKETKRRNEEEARRAAARDREESETLIRRQLDQRYRIQSDIKVARREHAHEIDQLRADLANYYLGRSFGTPDRLNHGELEQSEREGRVDGNTPSSINRSNPELDR